MDLKKTIEKLRSLENRSKKKGYIVDACNYSFRRLVLQLLAKISKEKIEEDTYVPQKSGKQRFKCSTCKGEGYIEIWEGGNKNNPENKVIKDCINCNGEGYVEIKVIDKRKKTKDKDLYYDDEY